MEENPVHPGRTEAPVRPRSIGFFFLNARREAPSSAYSLQSKTTRWAAQERRVALGDGLRVGAQHFRP